MFIGIEFFRITFFLRNRYGNHFTSEKPGGMGLGPALLSAKRESVLIGARDIEVFRNVFRSFRHGIGAVLALHERIDKAPADGGIEDLRRAAEGRIGFAHDERRTRHTLHAASYNETGFAGLDGARRYADCIHARAAEPVDRAARH